MGRLENKVALVTGAARGQGRSHAVRCRHHRGWTAAPGVPGLQYPGATVEDLAETVMLIEKLARRFVSARVDILNKVQLAIAVGDGVAELGGLDIAGERRKWVQRPEGRGDRRDPGT